MSLIHSLLPITATGMPMWLTDFKAPICYISSMKKEQNFSVIIERDKDGYFAYCPELQGCYTQGDTYVEAAKNIKEVVELHLTV
jgi:HicB_like antitoxin of bacterial toxin-antitoxin system